MANPVASLQRELNAKQELFCMAYVTNGGNASDAAISAGYEHPETQGPRNLTKPHIAQRIRQLVALDITSRLGELVTLAWSIINDPETPAKTRLDAIFGLMDRAGLVVPKQAPSAPSVAVQVNVSTSAAAQQAIKEIWDSRNARDQAKALPLATAGHAPDQDVSDVVDVQATVIEQEDDSVS